MTYARLHSLIIIIIIIIIGKWSANGDETSALLAISNRPISAESHKKQANWQFPFQSDIIENLFEN